MEDESNIRLAYATHEDIAACCPTETVLAIRVSKPSFRFSLIVLMAQTLVLIAMHCFSPVSFVQTNAY